MANLIIANFIDENFLSGCVGAIAPEALRLYNLRSEPVFRWSPSYLVCIIPFIFIGGCVAWFLEPTTKWAAFYSGLTTPVLLSTALKNSVKAQKELAEIHQENNGSEDKIKKLQQENEELQAQISLLKMDETIQEMDKTIKGDFCFGVKPLESVDLKSKVMYEKEVIYQEKLPSNASKTITKITIIWMYILTGILLTAVFTEIHWKITVLLLFFVFCNTIIAPMISKNKFIQQYFKGL